jgi:ribosomal protein L29
MIKMSDLRKKSEAELGELVTTARETLRAERFKDKFSRKSSVINTAKKEVAQALTELGARGRNPQPK